MQRLGRMQADYVYPTFGDRTSPKEWAELGKPDLIEKRQSGKKKSCRPRLRPDSIRLLDAEIRGKFNIHLPDKH